MKPDTAAVVRYIVHDVTEAIGFYELLGFRVAMNPGPGFAALDRGGLRLLLNLPGAGGAGQRSDHGPRAASEPEPGGWNRFQLVTDDLEGELERLRTAGAAVRTSTVEGRGGRQAVLDDPSGNPVELFEPKP
jgi:catechol 2,3-dioxygenase-like lactoylglutathione lyase family enzyme